MTLERDWFWKRDMAKKISHVRSSIIVDVKSQPSSSLELKSIRVPNYWIEFEKIPGYENFRHPQTSLQAEKLKTKIEKAFGILGVEIFSPHEVHGINFKWE